MSPVIIILLVLLGVGLLLALWLMYFLADACVGAARRIMTELLTQRAGMPRGRA